jgi:hypothetical protein
MNMVGQRGAKKQKPLTEERTVELRDEQLEIVSGGGHINYDAQDQILQGQIQGYQYLLTHMPAPVNVVNQNVNANNTSSDSHNQLGVAVKK